MYIKHDGHHSHRTDMFNIALEMTSRY